MKKFTSINVKKSKIDALKTWFWVPLIFLMCFALKMGVLGTKIMKYKSIYTSLKKQTVLSPIRARLVRLHDKKTKPPQKELSVTLSVQPPDLPPLSVFWPRWVKTKILDFHQKMHLEAFKCPMIQLCKETNIMKWIWSNYMIFTW